jgi:preprotein translocase subunit SecA
MGPTLIFRSGDLLSGILNQENLMWRERARETAANHRQELEGRLTEDGRLPDDWDNELDELQDVYGFLDDLDEEFDGDDDLLDEDEDADEDFDDRIDGRDDDLEEVIRPIMHGDPKVGRNDPCPCGSGKKFKKCCMNRQKNPPKIDW